jgi:hypothetical protein
LIFSEYTVLEKAPSSVDPLGFLKPSSAIADKLFRQFTVLSNHPAYQGFLCYAYDYLGRAGLVPGKTEFSRRFRDIEVLWGILNVWDDGGKAGSVAEEDATDEDQRPAISILNVTKYKHLLQGDEISLPRVRRYAPLYAKLNYGTLGHYSSPSIFWGLLDGKGVHLTPFGSRLAQSWRRRSGLDFEDLLLAWEAGQSISTIKHFDRAVGAFPLAASPSANEQQAWRDIIGAYCRSHVAIRFLWEQPLDHDTLDLSLGGDGTDERERAARRAGFFPAAIDHWKKSPDLVTYLRLAEHFEVLAGAAQMVFEWEYLRRLEEVRLIFPGDDAIPAMLLDVVRKWASPYFALAGAAQPRKLFVEMAASADFSQLARAVLEHHVCHQKSKGAMPYIEGEHITVRDKVNVRAFGQLLKQIDGTRTNIVQQIGWHYRRDWHFLRAQSWRRYAGEESR